MPLFFKAHHTPTHAIIHTAEAANTQFHQQTLNQCHIKEQLNIYQWVMGYKLPIFRQTSSVKQRKA